MAKIKFEAIPPIDPAVIDAYRAQNRALMLPSIKPDMERVQRGPLAVAGGGFSLDVEELREWDGEILAVNGTWKYLKDRGIESTLYTIDPVYTAPEGVTKALLGDGVAPSLIADLDCEIELIWTGIDQILHRTSSVSTVPFFAVHRGHDHVTFFGCDSSFGETTHTDRNEPSVKRLLWVECGGKEYKTCPQMIMTAEEMAETARAFPDYMTVRGEGFLQSLIEHGDYNVTHVSPLMHEAIAA